MVLIQDNNAIRGNWKLGKAVKTKIDDDGLVRNCSIKYKPNNDPSVDTKLVTIQRPVPKTCSCFTGRRRQNILTH